MNKTRHVHLQWTCTCTCTCIYIWSVKTVVRVAVVGQNEDRDGSVGFIYWECNVGHVSDTYCFYVCSFCFLFVFLLACRTNATTRWLWHLHAHKNTHYFFLSVRSSFNESNFFFCFLNDSTYSNTQLFDLTIH